MKRIGQIVGAAIVGIVCVALLPIIIPLIFVYTIYAVISSIFKTVLAAIKAKPGNLA